MQHRKLAFAFMLAATLSATGAGAQTADNVANTSQKGSLLIWPEVEIRGEAFNTIIRLHNDNVAAIDVKCYWLNGSKFKKDFSFKVTKKQPVWFDARFGFGTYDVPPFPTNQGFLTGGDRFAGTLICWAVDGAGANQVNFNHLSGSATVFEGEGVHEYNAWAFKARSGAPGGPVGVGGHIVLDGVQYDACPAYLHSTFVPRFPPNGTEWWSGVGDTELYVTSCNQDLQQDFTPYFTKLDFIVWNEHEVKATGAWQCIDSWYEAILDRIQTAPENFTFFSLKTILGRYKVTGVASTQCRGSTASGLVGVQETEFARDTAAMTLSTAGKTPGFVLWDVHDAGGVPEKR